MNYPATLSNPMLKRRPNPVNPDRIGFRHLRKPISAPRNRVRRPLTAITSKGKRVTKALPINHNFYNSKKEDLIKINDSDYYESDADVAQNAQASDYVTQAYNLATYHRPAPIRETIGAQNFSKDIKGVISKNTSLPPALGIDYTKRSSGMLTTTLYADKINIVSQTHKNSQYISPLQPMSAYFGRKPDPSKDPYNRRKVKQLDDISFSSDNEIEEHKDYRRMPSNVLTQENLKQTLTPDLKSLNLNNHYWLKNNFIDKIGIMAPNLVEMSLRGLRVNSQTFIDLVKHMGVLKILDISNCKLLTEEAIIKLAETNQGIVRFRASGCERAVTDKGVRKMVELSRCQMELLDLSYCTQLTDEGLIAFKEDNEEQIMYELYLNGLENVTNTGFSSIISSCDKTLRLLHMAINGQGTVTGEV